MGNSGTFGSGRHFELIKKGRTLPRYTTPILVLLAFNESKGSVSQLMDDLDLINSVEEVEVIVNSIQKGAENQKTSALVMLENLLDVFLICSTLFRSRSNLHEYATRLRGASTR